MVGVTVGVVTQGHAMWCMIPGWMRSLLLWCLGVLRDAGVMMRSNCGIRPISRLWYMWGADGPGCGGHDGSPKGLGAEPYCTPKGFWCSTILYTPGILVPQDGFGGQ